MKLLGVIGDPIQHSLSPALFDALLKELGLEDLLDYRAWRVRSEDLADFLAEMRGSSLVGVNVTLPHKERVASLLDGLDAAAALVGAVNTLHNDAGCLIGYNTDWIGFLRSLRERGIALKGQQAVVLGAGGAARAILYGLIRGGIGKIVLWNRTPARAHRLAQDLSSATGFHQFDVLEEATLDEALPQVSLLIHATPVGMHPAQEESLLAGSCGLHAGLLVYDLIYNPLKTPLLRQAEEKGAQIMNGLDMLIYQALESLAIWLAPLGRPQLIRRAEALIPRLKTQMSALLKRGG